MSAPITGFKVNGNDLNQLLEPISIQSIQISNPTGFITNGVGDLNTIFQGQSTDPGSNYITTNFKVNNYTPLWSNVSGAFDLGQIFSSPAYVATGNYTVSSTSSYDVIITFTSNGSFTLYKPILLTNFGYIAVGTGGNGGSNVGSGGGGGGEVKTGQVTYNLQQTYSINVATNNTQTSSIVGIVTCNNGLSASNSSPGDGGKSGNGNNGGSGFLTGPGPSYFYYGGGGGGNGGSGADGSGGGGGGNGTLISVTNTTYGVGGAGGVYNNNTTAASGTPNTGNGGAGGNSSSYKTGGKGGSGVVIIYFNLS